VCGLEILVTFGSEFFLHTFELLLCGALGDLVVIIALDLRQENSFFVTMGTVVGVVLLVFADIGFPSQVCGIDSRDQ